MTRAKPPIHEAYRAPRRMSSPYPTWICERANEHLNSATYRYEISDAAVHFENIAGNLLPEHLCVFGWGRKKIGFTFLDHLDTKTH